jgi:hypothetical protein
MKCGNPVLVIPGKNGNIYRNWLAASDIHRQTATQVFDCGKCLHCRKKRSSELAMRCVLNASMYPKNSFLTLTYDENKKGYHNEMDYSDIQNFKKRLRRSVKHKIEIFNVHEYGKKGKKHWHAIVFGHDFNDKTIFTYKNQEPLYTSEELTEIWGHGFTSIGSVTEASAMYQAQYMEKDYKNGNTTYKRKAKSNHSGIGKTWFLRNYKQVMDLGYIPFQGQKRNLPRYFEKIAERHYAAFYDKSLFHDVIGRKAKYSPLLPENAIKELADKWPDYCTAKAEFIKTKEQEWEKIILDNVKTGREPAFVHSLNTTKKDLITKNKQEKF